MNVNSNGGTSVESSNASPKVVDPAAAAAAPATVPVSNEAANETAKTDEKSKVT